MISRFIISCFIFAISTAAIAQIHQVPDSSAVNGVGTIFEITNSEYINVTVESSDDVFAYVQSMNQAITINVAKPVPELLSTTLTIKNLSPETSYNFVKNGRHEVITTDEAGVYECTVDLALPQKIQIFPQQ